MIENVSTEIKIHLNQITESLKANRCAILVGAGFSKNADRGSLFAPTFPTWNELADEFYEKLYSNKPQGPQYLNPLALAEQVEAAYGRPTLNQILISRIPDTQYSPSQLHVKLLSLPWKDVFTTNYDTLLERACKDITIKRFNVINSKEDLVSSSDAPRIIKLHGTFPSHRPFVITSEDYRRYPKDFAPFINTVQQSLLENTLCLIGFSGDDPNFNQWVGWIHDNLGLENSPQIYLFSHEEYSHAQKKLLDRKKVVILNISPFASDRGPREKYEGLLDYLSKSIKIAQVSWPDLRIINYEDKLDTSSLIRMLQETRKKYPGWLVLPHTMRKTTSFLRELIEKRLLLLLNEPHIEELILLYEYDWIREKCLRPPFQWELKIYSKILERHSINSSEEKKMIFSIQLSLLRDLRESGDFEGWNKLFNDIKSFKDTADEEQLNSFLYERCLFFMFTFQYENLKESLSNWNVNEQSPAWVLRKAGLLAEHNDLVSAQELLQSSLVLLRKQLQNNNQNLFLLSHESALMSLKNYIEHSISASRGELYERNEEELERLQAHKKLTIDWYNENERFELLLQSSEPSTNLQNIKPAFDFGRRISTFKTGEDNNVLNAYAFLRFRENTGHPFRINNVTNSDKTAIKATKLISSYSWSTVILVRTNKVDAVESVLSRSELCLMPASKADELSLSYLDALKRTIRELSVTKDYTDKSFVEFSAEVLPQLLSQFCCKCTISVLDQMLKLLLEIYKSDYILKYPKVNLWLRRLVKAFTSEQRFERRAVLLQFPYVSKSISMEKFPDPTDFFEIPLNKPTFLIEVIPETRNAFEAIESESDFKLMALRRLAILSCNGWLTQEQEEVLGNLLWGKNLVFQEPLVLSLSAMLPSPSNIKPKEIIRKKFIEDLEKEQANPLTIYEKNFNTLPSEIFSQVFIAEDMATLLPFFEAEQEMHIDLLKKPHLFSNQRDQRGKVHALAEKLFGLLINLNDWTPSKEEQEIMARILVELKDNQLSHIGLDLLWAKKCDEDVNVNKTINSYMFFGSIHQKISLYNTAIRSIENKQQELMNESEVKNLLKMVAQQILWRRADEHLTNAINMMCNIIHLEPKLVCSEIEEYLLIGLECLEEESNFEESDTEFRVTFKGELRVASARLSYVMNHIFIGKGEELPEVLLKWKDIYTDPNEFSEIRNIIDI